MNSAKEQEYPDYLKMLTQREIDERLDYILRFVKLGRSRTETQAKFRQRFGYGERQTRSWYVRAVDSLIIVDKGERLRTKAVMLEVLHSQIAGFQHDLEKFTDIITKIEADNDLRNMIKWQLSIVTDDEQINSLNQELKNIPSHSIKVLLEAIECRCKTREHIVKACNEIGRLHELGKRLVSIETAVVGSRANGSGAVEQS
jgi:hypothetical protein